MTIKKTFILQMIDGEMVRDEFAQPREFKSEKAALKCAKEQLAGSASDEVWVFGLTHVVFRPDIEPDVEAVS